MKCKDFELYQATYCGLCRCLRRRYGPLAPMLLNFDFTFLALLLWQDEGSFTACKGRCHANPLVKKSICQDSPALETAADESIILAWWRLRDTVKDSGFVGGLAARILSALLYPSYRRAAGKQLAFDRTVRSCLSELSELERESCTSIDRSADTFARLLQASVSALDDRGRVLSQLLYHLGRWIYLIDAKDDLQEDIAAGRYNPLAARFGPEGDDHALKQTLDHSLELMGAAFQLGEFGCRGPALENILYLGLPLVQRAVFDGSWAQIKKQKIWRNG